MRVKAKKRKIVPIEAKITVDASEYMKDPRAAAVKAREEASEILGRKVFEFCHKEFTLPAGGSGPIELTVKMRVIDMGKDGIRREKKMEAKNG